MGKADIHMHSLASDGTASVRQILDHVRDHTDLDVVAITDHDRMHGTLEALELASAYSFDVIPGVEITTLSGHLLALWVDRPVPMWRGLEWTLAQVHDQGGVAIVPHPLSPLTRSVGHRAFERVLARERRGGVYFDAVELMNPSYAGRLTAGRAARLNGTQWQLATTGGSDAHDLLGIGTAYTLFPGRGEDDLRSALVEGTTRAEGEWWSFGDHRRAARYKARRFLGRFGVPVPDQSLDVRGRLK
ncbi:MAG: PHP-associated domain-containing protein [Candidatus Dormibacteria bacterium]